jgi:hypothetical protein
MAKPTIVTRATKGSALTWTEGDANLTNLRDATITLKAGSGGTDVISDLNGTVTFVAGTNITLSGNNTNKTVTINASGGGIANLVEDTTPDLGGNLDLKGFIITSTGSAGAGEQINLVPGYRQEPINLKTSNIALNLTGNTTKTNIYTVAEQALKIYTNDNGAVGGAIELSGSSNGNITITPHGTGQTVVKNLEYNENIHSLGTTSGTITPNATNGNVQTITLNGNLTFSAFTSPVAGQSITLIINTGGTGRTLTSTMKFAGGEKTLSTTNTTDIISVFYDGTNYWASLAKDFK